MNKLIIENRSKLTMLQAIERVSHVMRRGRISNNNAQYCYYTYFQDGVSVSAFLNKNSDRFVVTFE